VIIQVVMADLYNPECDYSSSRVAACINCTD